MQLVDRNVKKAIMISVVLQSRRFCIGTKRAFVIGLCLAAVAAVVMLAAVIIRPPKIYISEICPSNSETSKKTAMQDKTENQAIG